MSPRISLLSDGGGEEPREDTVAVEVKQVVGNYLLLQCHVAVISALFARVLQTHAVPVLAVHSRLSSAHRNCPA